MQLFSAIPNMFPRLPVSSKGRAPSLFATSQNNKITIALSFLPLGKKSVPGKKRCSASIKLTRLFQTGPKKCYQCPKANLLKFTTFLQFRAAKHRVILGTAYTYSLSSGPVFLQLQAGVGTLQPVEQSHSLL